MILHEKICLICPICKKRLTDGNTGLFCPDGHSFDRARQGYVNLLPVQNKHSLMPGDAKDMLQSRRLFLDKGYYEPVCRTVGELLRKYCTAKSPVIADIGCGEGYYTSMLARDYGAVCIGADISKDAAKMACSRNKDICWIVATASSLPVKEQSTDAVTAVFSLFLPDEYARILRPGGIVIEVTAGNDHLRELKELIYDEVFEQHKSPAPCGDEFETAALESCRFTIEPDQTDLLRLLMMTPHSRRMKREKSSSLELPDKLRLTVDCTIRVLRKKQR